MASAKVQDFLRNHTEAPKSLTKVEDALAAVENAPSFNGHAERIRAILRDPTLGMATARQTNAKWLTDTFSSKQLARERFRQPLSPSDAANGSVLHRENLVAELHPFLTGEPNRRILYVIGGEGNGKSWLVAQSWSWLSVEEKPLMVILNPNAFADTAEQNDVQELLISALIEQTGYHVRDTMREKWSKILDRWREHPAERLRLAVFIDGLNQRPEKDWARVAEKFASELDQIGGQLIVTVRTQYNRDRVQRRLSRDHKEVEIPEWTEQERDRILAGRGIIATNLQPKVAASLLNPRLLGIALELLEGDDLAGLEELSVNRLLFEHIRANEQDAPVQQSANEFVLRLQNHANEVISRISSSHGDDPTVFDYDLQAVAEGRFYRTVEGYPSRYKLDEDGLILALGFAVIDRLYSASHSDRDLDEAVEEIIEPIAALDRTANVVLAALTVTCLDNVDPKIAATLIRVFADLQNPDVNEFNPFARLARICPSPFTEAAHSLCLSGGHQNNFDWVQEALMLAREDENAWKIIFKEIQTWLSYYSLAPERGLFSASFSSSSEEEEDHFFAMARPGMARFEARVAIAKHREFAQDVVRRQGFLLYLGLFELLDHNALLTKENGLEFLGSQESEETNESDLSEQHRWRISQYRLLLALPFLSGREQVDALLSVSSEGGTLPDLTGIAKPLEEKVFDDLLESACQEGDDHAQFVLLTFAKEALIPISINSRKHVVHLSKAQSERVRIQALGIIAQLDDETLLAEAARGDWRVSESDWPETSYGSIILVRAVEHGLIEHSDALDRMSPDFYGRAAVAWSRQGMRDAVREVGLRIHTSICRVANLETDIAVPDIEMRTGYEERSDSVLIISDRPADMDEQWSRFAESDEAFIERQKRNQEAYLAFRKRLTAQEARIILDHLGLCEFRSIVESNEDLADQ